MMPTTKRSADYKLGNTIFRVMYGDITQQRVDAIVSSDDNFLSMGGGVSEAILNAGGEVIREEARKHVPLKIGEVAVTSAGKLPAKYVFHAVTIDYEKMLFPCDKNIQRATLRCLQLSDTLGIKSISFPALGTGIGKFPFELCAEVMTQTVADYLIGETSIELVVLTLFPREIVKESDLNLFYERAVAKASLFTQSKRLNLVITELKKMVDQLNVPDLSNRVMELQTQLMTAQNYLENKNPSPKNFDEVYNQSGMGRISEDIVSMSNQIQENEDWSDRQLEAELLRTKMSGLYAQINVQYSNLNKYEIEKAKYGGIGVPPRLENAIEDIKKEIGEKETIAAEIRKQLASSFPASKNS